MIQNKVINVANTTVYQAQKQSALTTVIFCNTGTETDTITVYAVKNGGTPTASNTIINNLQMLENDTFVFDTEKLILDEGDSLAAHSTKGTTTATVSVMELV